MCPRLHPYVPQAATLCGPGCNPMWPRLQPYVAQVVPAYYVAFTLCSISGGGIVYQDFWGFT